MRTGMVGLIWLDDRDATAAAARAVAELTHWPGDSCALWSEAVRLAVTEGRLEFVAGLACCHRSGWPVGGLDHGGREPGAGSLHRQRLQRGAVFTSEDYGAEQGRRLGAMWVQVDPGRAQMSVSGTAVRADLAGHWWALHAPVRG